MHHPPRKRVIPGESARVGRLGRLSDVHCTAGLISRRRLIFVELVRNIDLLNRKTHVCHPHAIETRSRYELLRHGSGVSLRLESKRIGECVAWRPPPPLPKASALPREQKFVDPVQYPLRFMPLSDNNWSLDHSGRRHCGPEDGVLTPEFTCRLSTEVSESRPSSHHLRHDSGKLAPVSPGSAMIVERGMVMKDTLRTEVDELLIGGRPPA
jgi:hypothetical protein